MLSLGTFFFFYSSLVSVEELQLVVFRLGNKKTSSLKCPFPWASIATQILTGGESGYIISCNSMASGDQERSPGLIPGKLSLQTETCRYLERQGTTGESFMEGNKDDKDWSISLMKKG